MTRRILGLAATALTALAVMTLSPAVIHAQTEGADDGGAGNESTGGDYVTTTTSAERSLDVSAFTPVCIRDAPYIQYTIVPVGFVAEDGTASMVIRDRTGAVVETLTVTSLSGTILYPGAAVDAAGNAVDWPGWTQAADGSWIPDSSDAILRQGLQIEVTVNPTATASVSYPPATSLCSGPTVAGPPCVPGQNGDNNPADDCTPCVPGQNGDSNLAACTLPSTGSGGPALPLTIGALAVLVGLVALGLSRRRADDPTVRS